MDYSRSYAATCPCLYLDYCPWNALVASCEIAVQYAGRAQTVILVKLVGVGLLAFMGLAPQLWTHLSVMIPVYVVRTAVINSAYPLQKSILMDYVPKVSYCMVAYCMTSLQRR